MNWRTVRALVFKDLTLFFRNRFFAVMAVLSLVMFSLIYFVMPSSVDETLKLGLYAPTVPPALELMQETDLGLEFEQFESEEALKDAVTGGGVLAGLVLPADFIEKLELSQSPQITVYFASELPEEVREIVNTLITEMAYLQTGQPLNVDLRFETLGPDMAGAQIPQRDRMRSLFAVFVLMTETFGLAALISEEVERRTAQALLATPMRIRELFTAKAIVGVLLAFSQVLLLMVVVGGMSTQPVIIAIALLLGAVLVTGVGFLIASLGKDFMSVAAWGTPSMIVLSIPAFGVMVPGALSDWVKAIPSYYLTDTVYQVSNFGAGWGDTWSNLLILAGFNVVILMAGVLALRRKFR
ncbi:MAG: ABC transporter permease [Dehalococcoidia bacterium]